MTRRDWIRLGPPLRNLVSATKCYGRLQRIISLQSTCRVSRRFHLMYNFIFFDPWRHPNHNFDYSKDLQSMGPLACGLIRASHFLRRIIITRMTPLAYGMIHAYRYIGTPTRRSFLRYTTKSSPNSIVHLCCASG
jgi:hypothetical protein